MNLFADDVVLMAPTAEGMQSMLSICGDWAAANGLTWGASKCHALAVPFGPQPPLVLSGQPLEYTQSTEYLGVEIDAFGVTDEGTFARVKRRRNTSSSCGRWAFAGRASAARGFGRFTTHFCARSGLTPSTSRR